MRMSLHLFTRLTNAHSKKLQNHEAAIALHYTCTATFAESIGGCEAHPQRMLALLTAFGV